MTKVLIVSLFGEYAPITYTDYVYDVTNSAFETVERVAPGASGVDWQYVLGVALFAITLYSVLRILEAVIRNV